MLHEVEDEVEGALVLPKVNRLRLVCHNLLELRISRLNKFTIRKYIESIREHIVKLCRYTKNKQHVFRRIA